MWEVKGNDLRMTEGDFGVILPMTITGITFSARDAIKFTIKTDANGETVLEKDFTNITQNTVNIEITEEETDDLKPGFYVYSLDWYQDGAFLCNLIPTAPFRVVDKA